MGSSRRITLALVGLVVLVLAGWFTQSQLTGDAPPPSGSSSSGSSPGSSSETADSGQPSSGMPERALSDLPAEAADTWQLIEQGGPFPYPRDDGKVFGNREGLLPDQDRGYYHEYTVETPGSDDRGARRLVTGEADEVYYTGDHYESFVQVDVTR
ncbi:ribonuclease domain-containing protein [Actinophytocola algeriensis]|uniref:Guanyl-specific ribonuclease Sa n=1 Tax=Actinophytocola algeriensis TaxID=1768010 RepID=A0A7W7Q0M7_9PSEU|nr:ribonuclease domain-containing protein [Actinophytocola algeriensis]MBB4904673.1 guanyl-specific ribonuclease Sa [Actinophytocola algeriensis]MBE1476468.1 guanyl-specific ribonuclease Sa [Actinophytocola algeriensis]